MAVPLKVQQVAQHILEHLIKHQIVPKEDDYYSINGKYFPVKFIIEVTPVTTDGKDGFETQLIMDLAKKSYTGKKAWGEAGANSALKEIV